MGQFCLVLRSFQALKESFSTKGTRVTSVLELNLTAEDDGLTYSCQGSNNAIQVDLKESVTLHVRCEYPCIKTNF